jgi:ketosteroid isomerase-like protein
MKLCCLLPVTAVMLAGIALAQNSTTRSTDAQVIQHIKNLELERIQAGARKDVATVDAATADDYVQIDWNGKVLNKADTLARIKSSSIQVQSNRLDEVNVRLYGDVALVAGLATRTGSMDGKDISAAIRYTRVYVKQGGRWQVVQFQQTRVASD